MQITSYNIQFGRGLDLVNDLDRICDSIRGADIICLQEVDVGWTRSMEADQPRAISEILPEYFHVYGSSFNVDRSYKSENGNVVNQRRQHGNMVLSRWPIVSSRTFNLPKVHYPDKFNMQMGFIEAVVESDKEPIRVYNYHAGYLAPEERLLQLDHFATIFNRSPAEMGAWSGKADIDGSDWSNQADIPGMPVSAIVCGDFNCPPGSIEYQNIIANFALTDTWKLVDPGNQYTATLKHARTEDIDIAGKIDHIFVTDDLAGRVARVSIDHAAAGSDHKPIHCFIDH